MSAPSMVHACSWSSRRAAILLVTAELDELIAMSDRVDAIYAGRSWAMSRRTPKAWA
jgi:ABC-type uncharacterized transport system ATPase subunit